MEALKIRALTPDELYMFVMLEQNKNVDELFNKLKETDGGWVLKAIEKRFKAYNIDADKRVMIAVLSIGDGIVGICAKYVDDMVNWCNNLNHTKIDWNRFTQKVYPHGIPVFANTTK